MDSPALDEHSQSQIFILGAASSSRPGDIFHTDDVLLVEIPYADYGPCVRTLVKQGNISNVWPKSQAEYFHKLWDRVAKPSRSRVGIGFGTVGPLDETDYCMVISNYLEFGDPSLNNLELFEEIYADVTEDRS